MAQIKTAAGVPAEDWELAQPCTAAELVRQVTDKHGNSLRRMLLDESGQMQPTILLFVNDEQVDDADKHLIQDGDEVTFLSPIAGG